MVAKPPHGQGESIAQKRPRNDFLTDLVSWTRSVRTFIRRGFPAVLAASGPPGSAGGPIQEAEGPRHDQSGASWLPVEKVIHDRTGCGAAGRNVPLGQPPVFPSAGHSRPPRAVGPALDPQPVSVAAPLSAGSRGQVVRSRRARPARQMTTRRRQQATSRACCTDHSRQRATRRSRAEAAKSMRERSTTRSRRPGPPRTPMRTAVDESALSNPRRGTRKRLQPAETESPSRQHSLIDPSAAPSLVVSTHLRCSSRRAVTRSAPQDRGSRCGSSQWGNECRPRT